MCQRCPTCLHLTVSLHCAGRSQQARSTLGSFASVRLCLMAAPVTLELEGRCSTFALLWLFLFVHVEDGVFVDGVATRGWCISGLVCVGDEELIGVVHHLRLCHQPREMFIWFPTDMFPRQLPEVGSVLNVERRHFCPHHVFSLQVHEREVECGLDVLTIHDALGQAHAGSICQH